MQPHQCQFHWTNDCICWCKRHFLLGLFLHHILAQEARTHAWPQLKQRTHQPWQRASLRPSMPPLLQTDQSSSQRMHHQHHQQHSQIKMEFIVDAPCWTYRDEFDNDVQLDREEVCWGREARWVGGFVWTNWLYFTHLWLSMVNTFARCLLLLAIGSQ